MAKTRQEKEEIIKNLEDKVANMKSAVLVDYKGLKVKEIETLRSNLKAQNISFNVSKNSLTRIVFAKNNIKFEDGIFEKPLALAFATDDEVAPAREIALFAKTNEAIEIVGGILEKQFIDSDMVKKLAALPTKEQLYGQIVGTIAAPISGLANVLGGNIRGLVNALNALKEKKA